MNAEQKKLEEQKQELEQKLFELEKKIRLLGWDLDHNQINEARKRQLVKYKEEHAKLKEEMEKLILKKD